MNVIEVNIYDTPDMDPDDTPEARAARLAAQVERFQQDDLKRMDAIADDAIERRNKLRGELLEWQNSEATTPEGIDLKKRRTSEVQAALEAAEIQLKKRRGDYFGDEVEPVPAPGVVEAVPASEQGARRAHRYQMCVDAGLAMPENDYASLPRGIGRLADAEGITRQAFSEDVKAHIRSLNGR